MPVLRTGAGVSFRNISLSSNCPSLSTVIMRCFPCFSTSESALKIRSNKAVAAWLLANPDCEVRLSSGKLLLLLSC